MASSSSSSEVRIDSGPIETDVLWMQQYHISEHIWNTGENRRLKVRRAVPMYQGQPMFPDVISEYLHEAGFYWVCKLGYMKLDAGLLNAFIERWRPETHTFHMRWGECTITLEDVAVLVGLPVDGMPVIGLTHGDWAEQAETLLGVRPTMQDLKGSYVKLTWLAEHFGDVTPFLGDTEALRRYTRAWILRFIGGVMFVDKNSSRVSLKYLQFLGDFNETKKYAWGSALLGYLYRELCNATNIDAVSIGGMSVLVQLWAWERVTCLAPHVMAPRVEQTPFGHRWLLVQSKISFNDSVDVIRRKLDLLKTNEFLWQPYSGAIFNLLPEICLAGQEIWRGVVPLICFQITEWHQPDRVIRQFGFQQYVPSRSSQPQRLHQLTLRGKEDNNWLQLLQPVLQLWENRLQLVIGGIPQTGPMSYNNEYMVWYRKKSKLYIDRKSAQVACLGDITDTLFYMASPEGWSTHTPEDLIDLARKMAVLSCEVERVTQSVTNAPFASERFLVDEPLILPNSLETRGLTRNRPAIDPKPYILPPMPQRGAGMYYTPSQFTQLPSQMPSMYNYPTDISPSTRAHSGDASSSQN